jgi:hypothetical protein
MTPRVLSTEEAVHRIVIEDSGPGAGARCRRRSSEALVRPQEWGSQ